MENELKLKFEPNTIEHLGVKMYSHIPPAIAELVANSYDACAKLVHVKLYNNPQKRIVIEDNGIGMSFNEINNNFLRIGRNRRKENQINNCNRNPTGKKGLGKLALFGLGNTVEISTAQDHVEVSFTMNYDQILNSDGEYKPTFEIRETEKASGTTITLKELKHKSTFSLSSYSSSLARLFNFRADDFELLISLDDKETIKIDNKLKYENITPEFEWSKEDILKISNEPYEYKGSIRGSIITTEKPIKPELRGVTLFANGRMINSPEFFGKAESSHFYSYTTGWLDVDFVDDWPEDVISTNRQSIDWENEKSLALKKFLHNILTAIEKDWRNKRSEKKEKKVQENTGINIVNWKKTLPVYISTQVDTIISKMNDSELSSSDQESLLNAVHNIAPEYPLLHWRHLHSEIKSAARIDYERQDYYRAFIEAVKRYINKVREKSGSTNQTDGGMMGTEFGHQKILQVAAAFNKPNGNKFHADTYKCIEEGQKYLSMGIVSGARNPISHEEIGDLRDSGLFSEKDCLDMLSLLSHLFKRLEDAPNP
ncbi:TIGR02391 family protein [Sphingobacterium pedocola]|uniref:TIGR02391 family protein n=1 Tax=Sphingobacterium pedocola TaxID=2082722 RepID=A0ABR9T7A7_9SPHI|nr:TIGR02391 family protein [Sphingobacterium pedocola]MBE8721180.1 TIGR02391 family protein [Sphingobacterium pedocola]